MLGLDYFQKYQRIEMRQMLGVVATSMARDRVQLPREIWERFGDAAALAEATRGTLQLQRVVRAFGRTYRYVPLGVRLQLKDPEFSPEYEVQDLPIVWWMTLLDEVNLNNQVDVRAHAARMHAAFERSNAELADAKYVRDTLAAVRHQERRNQLYQLAVA